jgi:cytochrome P450 family 9
MNEREKKNISRPDVVQLLLQARKGQLANNDQLDETELKNFSAHTEFDVSLKNEKMSNFEEDDWIAQGFIFFGAGFDTSTSTLQVLFYELVQNPQIQEDLIDEIDQVLENGDVTYENLHKMKLLDMIVSEVLRKWPPAGQLDRYCNKDYMLELNDGRNLKIPEGTVIFLPVYNIHHDPEYFEDPEKFDPYRFSEENQKSIRPGTYLPFGGKLTLIIYLVEY